MIKIDWNKKRNSLSDVFSPSAPINSMDVFRGRRDILQDLHMAVQERGEHAIIHGDRGVGKTSLANIMDERYIRAKASKTTCNRGMTLSDIWFSLFRNININIPKQQQVGFNADNELDFDSMLYSDFLDKDSLTVNEICYHLQRISEDEEPLLFIIDEFDQIESKEVKQDMSYIIKYLSDHIYNITVLLVGIGFTVSDLLIGHQSIERCLRQIKLERMSEFELREIIDTAADALEMNVDERVISKIIEYSSGFPHFTHLLGKYVFLDAINCKTLDIVNNHFQRGMSVAIRYVHEGMKSTYSKATMSNRDGTKYKDVITACAFCRVDDMDSFQAKDLKNAFKLKFKKDINPQAYYYHLGKFCSNERGNILMTLPTHGKIKRYRFSNPLMKAYIRLLYHQNSQS